MKWVTAGELRTFFIVAIIGMILAGVGTFLVLWLGAPPAEERRLPEGNPFFDKNPVKPQKDLSLDDFLFPGPAGQLNSHRPLVSRPEGQVWTPEEVQKDFIPYQQLDFYGLPEKADKEMEDFLKDQKP